MIDWQEFTDWSEYIKLFSALFVMVSPPIIFPLFLGTVGHRSRSDQLIAGMAASVGYLVVMIAFTFLGKGLLNVFGISISAFQVAGGILLLIMAIEMLRSNPDNEDSVGEGKDTNPIALGIVPLAIPILAGPGTISTLVIVSNIHEGITHKLQVTLVVFTLFIYLLIGLRTAAYSGQLLSRNANIIFFRLMGLVIAAIAVEFVLDGVAGHFTNLEISH